MDLNILWFILIAVLFTGFFFLEGFDFGVGMLLPFLGKNDTERRTIISSIGPFWDGNEVWLITAGGAMFAAFPHWYATLFSGFYLALVLMLVGLIVRAVAFEFRNKDERPGWRSFWDWMIFLGSFLPSFVWGVALTNIVVGLPINAEMDYVGGFWNLLNPYALIGGIAFVTMFILHGAIFLSLRTRDHMLVKAQRAAKIAWFPALLFVGDFLVLGFVRTDVIGKFAFVPIIAILAVLLAGVFAFLHKSGWAFIMTGISIVLVTASVFAGLFPNVMLSSLNPVWNMTIYSASSSAYTLGIMSWIALTMVPIVLAYQGWNYWVFRERIVHGGEGH